MKCAVPGLLAAILLGCGSAMASPFTFQGELRNGGVPANGLYDLKFSLFTAQELGAQVGSTLCADNVTVVEGRFTVTLDYGTVFDGSSRYVEMQVRADTGLGCGTNAGFTTLGPRSQVTNAPMSEFAAQAGVAASAANATNLNGQPATFYQNAANLTGVLADTRLSANIPKLNSATSAFTGAVTATSFAGAGTLLTGLNATNLASGTVADARLSTNIAKLNQANVFAGGISAPSFVGSGVGLSSLNASSLTSGTVADARLTPNVALQNAGNFFNQRNTFGGQTSFLSLVTLDSSVFVHGLLSVSGAGSSLNVGNPNDVSAIMQIDWNADVARLRVTGLGVGGANGLDIQNSVGTSLMRLLDAGRVGIGTATPTNRLHVSNGASGATASSASELVVEDNSSSYVQILTPDVSERGLAFGSPSSGFEGGVYYSNATGLSLRTGGNGTRMTISPTGDVAFTGSVSIASTQRFVMLSGLSFTTVSGMSRFGEQLISSGGASTGIASAPVQLPHGARVDSVTVYGGDTSANNFTVTLVNRQVDPIGSSVTMATVTSSGSAGTINRWATSVITDATVDTSTKLYYVQLSIPANTASQDHAVLGVRIAYSITSPLP
jgi:hypothetical protein